MAEPIKVKGIIIRQTNYSDYDKMLTVLTENMGKITVSAKGVRSMKNKNRAASELLCFNEFVLTRRSGSDVYTLSQATIIESFYKLREDVFRLSLGIYMADLTGHLAPEEMGECLKVLLNSLYMLGDSEKNMNLVKLIYELKILSSAGFTPQVSSCVNCGKEELPFSFSAITGGVLCRRCASLFGLSPMKEHTRAFMEYILEAKLSKSLYEVKVDDETLSDACRYTEEFVEAHVFEKLKTLEYYKKLVKMS